MIRSLSRGNLVKLIFVIVLLGLLILGLIFLLQKGKPEASSLALKDEIGNYNKVSISLLKNYKKDSKAENLNNLKTTLKNRQSKMEKLAASDPEGFVALAMPESLRTKFPSETESLIEGKTDLSGVMEVVVWDDFNGKKAGRTDKVKTSDGKSYELYYTDQQANIKSGDQVKVKGIQSGSFIVTASTSTTELGIEVTSQSVAAAALSTKKGAIILFNFSNDSANQPFNLDALKTVAFTATNSTNAYWQEASYGALGLTGDGYGPYTIAATNDNCYSNYNTWASQANSAAAANGFNAGNYNNIMYVFPKAPGCGWVGQGLLNGSLTWFNGVFNLGVNAHELGHNIGLMHGTGYQCIDASGLPVALSTNCKIMDYQDYADIMGGSSFAHYQAYYKVAKGWIPSANVKTVTASGTFTIFSEEQPATGIQLLKIPSGDPSGMFYYLEARNNYGFDKGFYNTSWVTGVAIRMMPGTISGGYDTKLLDLTPGDDVGGINNNYMNGQLLVGQTFTDPFNGTTIKLISKDQAQATLEVSILAPTCVKANPTTTISPSSGPAVASGTAVNYTVSIKNENSSACATTKYDLTAGGFQTGWTKTFNPTSLNLSSGQTGTATFTVTSPVTATDGSYPFYVSSNISGEGQYYSSANASYWVYNTNPNEWTVSVSTDRMTYSAGGTIYSTASVLRNGATISGTTVDFVMTSPSGAVATKTGVSPSRSGVIQWKYRLNKNTTTKGTYTITATAKYNGVIVGSGQTTFTVQ